MAITIRCSGCQSEFRVDDSLTGKRVKCRNCGQAITVTTAMPAGQNWGEPGLGATSTAAESGDVEVRSPLLQAVEESAGAKCPKCGARVAGESSVCFSCGYNFRTRSGGTSREIPLAATAEEEFKHKRPRHGGSEILNSIDKYLGVGVFLMMLAGTGVWLTHVIRGAGSFSTGLVVPVIVVVALLAGVMAPLMLLGIQIGCHLMRWKPRQDIYVRLMITLFLPLGVALLCGGHEAENPLFGAAMTWIWVITPAVYLYLFRAEMQEWLGTAVAGIVGFAVGWGAVIFAGALVTLVTGPLIVEALPSGPWLSLASAHLEKPQPKTEAPKVAEAPKPAPAPVSSEPLPPPPPVDAGPAVVNNTPPEPTPPAPNVTPAPSPAPSPAPVVRATTPAPSPSDLFGSATGEKRQAPTQVASNNVTEPTTGVLTPPDEKTKAPPVRAVIKSPLVAEVTSGTFDGPPRAVITSAVPSSWLLTVRKGEDETAVVQRWSMDPPAAKGEMIFPEAPREPNTYALSPHGDILLVLTRFPKWELDVVLFETKVTTMKIDLTGTLPDSQKAAVPTLIGFLDGTHYLVRWDVGGQSEFHVMQTNSSKMKLFFRGEPYESGPNGLAISPDGKYVAIMNKGAGPTKAIVVYDTATGTSKRINPTSMEFMNQGMAFSPDSRRLALFAQTVDADMVITFNMIKGDMLTTSFLHGVSPIEANASRGLLWLKSSPVWVVNGVEMFDAEMGKKLGPLQVGSVIDARATAAGSILVTQSTPEGDPGRYTVLKMDDTAIQNAIAMTRRK